jgi:hypothetical protein
MIARGTAASGLPLAAPLVDGEIAARNEFFQIIIAE